MFKEIIPGFPLIAMYVVAFITIIALSGFFLGGKRSRYVDYDEKLERSGDYRTRYFDANPGLFGKGWYICPYCGKVMRNKKKIDIDHIHSVHRVKNSMFLTRKFKKLEDGVNDLRNLTHSCRRCNRRKGSKGGIWVLLGRYGLFIMFPLRLLFYVLLIFVVATTLNQFIL